MFWTLQLGPELIVESDGHPLGTAPNTTVAVLLVCLAAKLGRPTLRTSLAAELYPDSSPYEAGNALRQSLLRLRKWLGDKSISCLGKSVELRCGCWTITPNVHANEKLDDVLLVGVSHAAMGKYRKEWTANAPPNEGEATQAFVYAVTTIAAHDLFGARAIFLSGGSIINRVGLDDLRTLLQLTKPKTWEDPHAFQYYEQEAFFRIRECNLGGVINSFSQAFRIADRQRDQKGRARTAAHVACGYIELGEMGQAAHWLDKLSLGKNPTSNLMMLSSRACFHWNAGRRDLALETMNEARIYLPKADRVSAARFWVNHSLLNAEAGRSAASADAVLHATDIMNSGGLILPSILEVARATQFASSGMLYESIDLLASTLQTTRLTGHRMDSMYVEEALAEVLARVGRLGEAKTTWRSALAKRSAKLNPRTLAKHRKIETLCA